MQFDQPFSVCGVCFGDCVTREVYVTSCAHLSCRSHFNDGDTKTCPICSTSNISILRLDERLPTELNSFFVPLPQQLELLFSAAKFQHEALTNNASYYKRANAKLSEKLGKQRQLLIAARQELSEYERLKKHVVFLKEENCRLRKQLPPQTVDLGSDMEDDYDAKNAGILDRENGYSDELDTTPCSSQRATTRSGSTDRSSCVSLKPGSFDKRSFFGSSQEGPDSSRSESYACHTRQHLDPQTKPVNYQKNQHQLDPQAKPASYQKNQHQLDPQAKPLSYRSLPKVFHLADSSDPKALHLANSVDAKASHLVGHAGAARSRSLAPPRSRTNARAHTNDSRGGQHTRYNPGDRKDRSATTELASRISAHAKGGRSSVSTLRALYSYDGDKHDGPIFSSRRVPPSTSDSNSFI